MGVANCIRCGRLVTRRQGGSAGRRSTGDRGAQVTCRECLADEAMAGEDAESEAGWTKQLAAEIDARDGHAEGDAADGGLEQRVRAELDLDPLTAATLIVAEEDKRLSE